MTSGGCVRLGLGNHVVHVYWEVVRLYAGHNRGGCRRGVKMPALQDIARCLAVRPRESRCHGRRPKGEDKLLASEKRRIFVTTFGRSSRARRGLLFVLYPHVNMVVSTTDGI